MKNRSRPGSAPIILLYVLNQSVTSVRSAWRFIDLFERLNLAVEPHYALNRFQPTHSITQKQLENTLGRPMYAEHSAR